MFHMFVPLHNSRSDPVYCNDKFKGLVLKAFSKVELRSPELQHVLAYVQDKVVGMSREDYRDFLVLHKLPIPNSLTEQVLQSMQIHYYNQAWTQLFNQSLDVSLENLRRRIG